MVQLCTHIESAGQHDSYQYICPGIFQRCKYVKYYLVYYLQGACKEDQWTTFSHALDISGEGDKFEKKSSMYSFILKFHSGLAYLALIGLVLTVLFALIGLVAKRKFSSIERIVTTVTMGLLHLQVIIGIILFVISPVIKSYMSDMGASMGDAIKRMFLVEHPLMMLIGALVFTLGRKRALKADSDAKSFRVLFIFSAITLILIASRVPWDRIMN